MFDEGVFSLPKSPTLIICSVITLPPSHYAFQGLIVPPEENQLQSSQHLSRFSWEVLRTDLRSLENLPNIHLQVGSRAYVVRG